MKIAITSDTHGNLIAWQKMIKDYFGDAELILHAGDVLYHGPRNPITAGYNPQELARELSESKIPLLFSKGNCDADIDETLIDQPMLSPYAFLVHEGRRIMVNHGDKIDEAQMHKVAERFHLDLFISGHWHIPRLERVGNTWFLNPGSPSVPKQGIPTAALIVNDQIRVFELESGHTLLEGNW